MESPQAEIPGNMFKDGDVENKYFWKSKKTELCIHTLVCEKEEIIFYALWSKFCKIIEMHK